MIKGIAHVAYQVSDMKKALKFYDIAFGFKKKFELYDDEDKPWIVYLEVSNNQFIELFYARQEVEVNQKSSYQHLCLEVNDIYAIAKHFESKGIDLLHPIILGKDNNYQCWVKDPDGNPIELMAYGQDSLQLKS